MLKTKSFLLLLIISLLLFSAVTTYNHHSQAEVKAKVLNTDNSDMINSGVANIGNQNLTVKILEGKHKHRKLTAYNGLTGKLQLDNYFQPGDIILVALQKQNSRLIAKAVDLYRLPWELLLFGIFILLLLLYAKTIGLKALFSFIISLYIIWNFLIPGLLAGKQPIILSAATLLLLSAIIIFSVAGFNKKGLAAFLGTITGLLFTIIITMIFGEFLSLQGMTAPFAETLLYSGHLNLNMKHILYAAIVIGASGAAMDIAMDVAASMAEIKAKKPDIEMKELINSGFTVGRAVIGTMTTTLLLAYSGGYLTLLMLFMTKNSSLNRMLNFKMVSAEILRTLTGSIGLVLVAPITAFLAGWIYCTEFSINLKPNLLLEKIWLTLTGSNK